MKRLPAEFYNRPTLEVALDLLGCHLIRDSDGIKTGGMIVEVEAYVGENDPACHASRGLTPRNKIMYGSSGFLYVYFTYGNHFMLNVVTEKEGFPAAVLLRGLEPLYNIEVMSARRQTDDYFNISSGPGKLARSLDITTAQNGADLVKGDISLLGPGNVDSDIWASTRIGIGNPGSDKLWRFYACDNPHVSGETRSIKESSRPLADARKNGFSLRQ